MPDILFLAHRVPYPPNRGDKIRSYNILKYLAQRYRVHLAAFIDDEADEHALDALRPILGRVHAERRTRSKAMALACGWPTGTAASVSAFAHRGMIRAIGSMLAQEPIDTLYVFSGQMAQFVPAGRRFVMDFVDMDSQKFADYARTSKPPMRWLWQFEANRLLSFERETARRATISLFVSRAEADLFREQCQAFDPKVRVLENGVDSTFYEPSCAPKGAPLIVFTGQMDYAPNIAGAKRFAWDSLPAIQKRYPGARFAIVGRKPDPSLYRLCTSGVVVTGEVPDVRPWLARAHIVVVPLRIARGVQNKILEAMAMGRPVVASPEAFEGIDAQPGRDLVVADGSCAEIDAVLSLLDDPVRAEAIGAAARSRIVTRYAWSSQLAPLDVMLRE